MRNYEVSESHEDHDLCVCTDSLTPYRDVCEPCNCPVPGMIRLSTEPSPAEYYNGLFED